MRKYSSRIEDFAQAMIEEAAKDKPSWDFIRSLKSGIIELAVQLEDSSALAVDHKGRPVYGKIQWQD